MQDEIRPHPISRSRCNFGARDRRSPFITIGRDDEERLNKLQMIGNRSVLYLPKPDRYPEVKALAREVRTAYPPAMNPPMVRWAKSDDGGSEVFSVEEQQPIDFGDWRFLYESKDWRPVPLAVEASASMAHVIQLPMLA